MDPRSGRSACRASPAMPCGQGPGGVEWSPIQIMRTRQSFAWMCWLLAGWMGVSGVVAAPVEDGFEPLFDGTSLVHWRGYRKGELPDKGWVVEGDTLRCVARARGGDIITREKFADFDLRFEWKVAEGANSGVMYRVSEDLSAPWHTGPEYQVLDDARHADGRNPKTSAGALYALIACDPAKVLKPVGEWNEGRIVVSQNRVEHWLNGVRVVAFELGSPALQELISRSKFRDLPRFARETTGHICLQDHDDDVWYRRVRIRRLDPWSPSLDSAPPNTLTPEEAKAGWELLFDGQTATGWRGFGRPGFPDQGWVVKDGWLTHLDKGGGGDIITDRLFDSFELQFDWRIAHGGNSGLKYFVSEARKAPIGHEYQLIDDEAHPDAGHGRNRRTGALYDALPPTQVATLPAGSVNRSRLVVRGNDVEHWLNGVRVLQYTLGSGELEQAKASSKFRNEKAWGTRFPTPLLLQDHADEVAYRNIRIRALADAPGLTPSNAPGDAP
jgi:hypothetical protein